MNILDLFLATNEDLVENIVLGMFGTSDHRQITFDLAFSTVFNVINTRVVKKKKKKKNEMCQTFDSRISMTVLLLTR